MAESSSRKSQGVSIAEFQKLQQQFHDLLARQSKVNTLNSSQVYIEKDPPPESGAPLKPTKLPEYHGNRTTYPAWRTAVLDIFRIDWNLFGYDNSRAFLMIFSALKGTASEKAGPFYEAGGVNGTRDPADFLEFLDRINLDSTRVSRANKELHLMKMRENQRWPDFFASWSNKVTEARGDFWPDENKISMLENALSNRLTQALAGNHLIPDNDFSEWVRIVNRIAQKVEMADQRMQRGLRYSGQVVPHIPSDERRDMAGVSNYNGPEYSQRLPERNMYEHKSIGDVDESGDTIMGGINSAKVASNERRRAKWKTKTELENLRREGKCFRCERQGCTSKKCPLLPAKRPKNNVINVNSVELPDIDPNVYIIDGIDDMAGTKSEVSEK